MVLYIAWGAGLVLCILAILLFALSGSNGKKLLPIILYFFGLVLFVGSGFMHWQGIEMKLPEKKPAEDAPQADIQEPYIKPTNDSNTNSDIGDKENVESTKQNDLKNNSDDDTLQISTEYKNALKKAESYSKMFMSKQAIYDQLTSEYGEKFPADAAQYAVDNLVADYKENALQKAKQYYEKMSMSKEAVRSQLTSEYGEKFTQEEADYAIENLD